MYSTSNQTNPFHGIDKLLDYFHMECRGFPKDVAAIESAVDFLNEETDLILVPTSLEGDWYRTAAGPLLALDQEGMDVAVLPDWRGRYYFQDEGTGRRIYITGKNCRRFPKAYSVTRDFPGAAIETPALVGRMFRELSWYEGCLLLVWGVLSGGLWTMLAAQIQSALSGVVLMADRSALWGGAGTILLLSLLEVLLVFTGGQVVRRVSQKAALAVLLGVGGRLYVARQLDESDGVAAAMTALRSNAERLMTWVLTALWEFLAVLMILPSLWDRSTAGFAAAVFLAPVLYIAAVAVFLIRARRKVYYGETQKRREWLLHRASDRRLGIERPFPMGENDQRPPRLLGAAWPVIALLALPVICISVDGGYSTTRLVQTMLLYLPAAALPFGMLLGAAEAGQSLAEIRFLLPLAERQPAGHMSLPPMGSVFELKDVTFAYPDQAQPVLEGVNLRLHPGEIIGILGATGSGKTTLARLMTGLIQPTGGNIYYGGIELTRYNGSSLRRRIAYDRGADILLCEQVPAQRDGRTCVVFSAREDGLRGCQRILRLANGQLVSDEREENM